MKRLLFLILLIGALAEARALTSTQSGQVSQPLTVTAANYSIDFAIDWSCDDYPAYSAPGRIELRDAGGNLVARLSGSVYRDTGPSFSLSGGSTVTNTAYWMFRYARDGAPADGSVQGTWNLTGLAPGQYTLRLFGYTTNEVGRRATTVWTNSSVSASYPTSGANTAPSIAWSSAPTNAANGQGYTVSARAHDDDGNLAQVNVWKNGQPFAFAGGGNGTDGDSGNPTSDSGPQTITFTAQAVDASGATSPVITHTVTIEAPVNRPPNVTLDSPGSQTITAGTTLSIRTTATDADGNLTNHNIDILRPAGDWNFQGGFASGEPFQGGPVGSAASSTRSASFTFSDVGTYTLRAAANDGSGWIHSGSVTITVNPAPVPNRAPTITWLNAPNTAGHLQSYTVTAHGQDADGNLAQVNVWKNGAPFAFAGGGNGTDGDSGNPTSDSGPQTITFTAQAVDATGATSPVITHTVTIGAPPNTPPAIAWTLAPTRVGSGQSYTVSARATDADGNLIHIAIRKDGVSFADANGGNGFANEASANTADVGPKTVSFTAVATDAFDGSSGTITHTVTVDPPAPVQFTLTTSATSGGTVSAGGSFVSGTSALVSATPDGIHDFAGWSGDASGSANPLSVVMDRDKSVQALFTIKSYALATSASSGGSVTAGGVYPYGTTITLTATASPTARFTGWAGDASGVAPSVAIVMNGPKSVQALFVAKAAQSITFPTIADQNPSAAPVALAATASSGLPVSYAVLSGPATVSGNQLRITGPGLVTVEARQPGDDFFLEATAVARAFNVVAAARLKYRAPARTVLESEANRGAAPFVIEKP